MRDLPIYRLDSPQKSVGLWSQLFIGAIGLGIVLAGLPAQADESQPPWECSSYTGDAHTRCVETFAEWQRDQITALQGKLQAQQETVKLLKDQLDRQTSTTAELQRQLARPSVMVPAAPPLYTSPSVGFGLYLGSPWIYGSPYYYSPFFYGPRYYGRGYWGHRW